MRVFPAAASILVLALPVIQVGEFAVLWVSSVISVYLYIPGGHLTREVVVVFVASV